VEGRRVTATLLARSVVEPEYLRVGYLAGLWRRKGCAVSESLGSSGSSGSSGPADEPVIFVGLERPENLPAGSGVYTLDRLGDLIPA